MQANIDTLWLLVCCALVFFMQIGFTCFEVGNVREKSVPSVAVKNILDWLIVSILYFTLGYNIMYGDSIAGIFGWDAPEYGNDSSQHYAFLLYQSLFVASAATIVSGAVAERIRFANYLIVSGFVGLLIYPVYGHWVWGGLISNGTTLLSQFGYIDFAGATVVHVLGGSVALIGISMIGPRLDRFDSQGVPRDFPTFSTAWAAVGVMALTLGWWGFNGGSALGFDRSIPQIIFNTNLAAAAGGITSFSAVYFTREKRHLYNKLFGGILGSLVAITASCHMVSPTSAILIGALAGVLHNMAHDFILYRLRLDDPVGAVPVHLCCGVLGAICVGVLGDQSHFNGATRATQIGVQAIGAAACVLWSLTIGYAMFWTLRKTVGLRVSPQVEREGIQIGFETKPTQAVDPETLKEIEELMLQNKGKGDF